MTLHPQVPKAHAQLIRFLRDWLRRSDVAGGPLYMRLSEGIAEATENADSKETTTLPSERNLADALGLSRGTVRRAVGPLVEKGRLVRRQGTPTMVARRLEKSLSNLIGFSEDIEARGMTPGTRWLSKGTYRPTTAEVNALALPPGEMIARFKRLRLADGQPIAIECAAVPSRFLPDPETVIDSLYAVLRERKCPPVRGRQRIQAGAMNKEEATLLKAKPEAPMLIIERCCITATGQPVEFTRTRYNAECYDFLTDLFT